MPRWLQDERRRSSNKKNAMGRKCGGLLVLEVVQFWINQCSFQLLGRYMFPRSGLKRPMMLSNDVSMFDFYAESAFYPDSTSWIVLNGWLWRVSNYMDEARAKYKVKITLVQHWQSAFWCWNFGTNTTCYYATLRNMGYSPYQVVQDFLHQQ